ncbi:MAG: hypothetical protein CSA65_01990 [Proteobacteria bacterium]|nr:MAG: hypothetical protein CSA65_01990 [Pseudomonadota bacterium]
MRSAAARVPAENESRNPELSRVLRLTAPPTRLAKLPRPVRDIAELFDGKRRVAEILVEARISEAKGLAVVKKLATTQIVSEVPRRRRHPAFTDLEEAFFNADVAPIDECDLPFETLAAKISRTIRGGQRLPNTITRKR